jgi:hypothetical protein
MLNLQVVMQQWFGRRRSKPVGAPKLTIRRHTPLWLRLFSWIALVAIGAAVAIFVWQQTVGKGMAEREALVLQNQELKASVEKLEAERTRLQTLVDSSDSKIAVERTAQQTLAAQLKGLEAENTKLKSDLAYMESLLPAGAGAASLAIRRFQVEKDRLPNQWLLKALIVQAEKNEREFAGVLQVIISGVQAGKNVNVTWPDTSNKDGLSKSKLNFKRMQRLEETISTPADLQVKSMQLRIIEQGLSLIHI